MLVLLTTDATDGDAAQHGSPLLGFPPLGTTHILQPVQTLCLVPGSRSAEPQDRDRGRDDVPPSP